MSQGSESNPLFLHGIVMFVVAACIVVAGILGMVEALKEMPADAPQKGASTAGGGSTGVTGALQKAQKTQNDAKQAENDAKSLTTGGGANIGTAMQKVAAAKRLQEKAKSLGKFVVLLPAIAMILVGIGTGVCGFFLIKQANWARLTAFGLLSATLLYFTYIMSERNAARNDETGELLNDFNVIWPIGITVIAILAGKFLWDLFVEKFAPAPAAA